MLGVVIFLYLIWRNLRDDYHNNLLISYSWLAILSFFIFGRMTFGVVNWGVWNDSYWSWWQFWVKTGFDYYGGIGGILLVTWLYCSQNNWKLWSFFEDITAPLCLLMSFMMVEDLIVKFNLRVLIYLLISIFGFIYSNVIAKKYRSFVWYKSGKKGFVFLFMGLIIGILLTITSLVFMNSWISVILNVVISLFFLTKLISVGEVFKK